MPSPVPLGEAMRRRDFVKGIAGSTIGLPLAARAQQLSGPVIGFLSTDSPDESGPVIASFREGLAKTGFVEGQNVVIEYRWARGQYDRMSALATDLVRRQVAVIDAMSLAAAQAAKVATTTIPIVFVTGDDPVKFGLVASLNKPGGNMTGITFLTPDLEAKRIEVLHAVAPNAMIAALVNPSFPASDVRLTLVRSAVSALGFDLIVLNASSEHEIDTAFASVAERRIGALLVTSDPFLFGRRQQIVSLAAGQAIPTLYFSREFAAVGGLMSYGANLSDAFRQSGTYVGRILKGEKPVDLPVLQPTKFEFVINLKTAKALGLTIPPAVLALADEVIE
jgi:putative tryptophan/tyrosine transport system substrate-binding protein